MKTLLIAAALILPADPALAQSHGHDSGHAGMTMAANEQTTGTGTVHSVNAGKRTVNMTHQPIPSIGWPAMTMDFAVAESIDLSKLQPGTKVTFTLSKGADGIYMIDSVKPQ